MNTPKDFNMKGKLSIRRLTPLVINMMTLLNINISVEKHERIETNLQLGGQEGRLSVEDFITVKAVLGLVLPLYLLFLGVVSGKRSEERRVGKECRSGWAQEQ